MSNKTKIYFLSDVHLGSASHQKTSYRNGSLTLPNTINRENGFHPNHDLERKLCRWFDSIKKDAKTIFLLGDIFDFWFEYKSVVPRGFTRVLGKIAELTDSGIKVHFFVGNHDLWLTDYLQKESGVIVHKSPLITDINGKKFFLAHGDGLGDNSKTFKLLRYLFHNNWCQKAFATLHPRWALAMAHKWSNHSRTSGGCTPYMGEDKEHLVLFAKEHLQKTTNINFFIFGHRHIMLDLMLTLNTRVVILGDWINYFSYAVFDGENLTLEIFEEKESIS